LNHTVRATALGGLACALIVALSSATLAQNFDLAVGGGRMAAPAASQADRNHSPESLNGGTYLSVSGDVLLHERFGVEAEVAWRGSRAIYYPGGYNQPYRPFFYDVNAIWVPKLSKRVSAEIMGGVGLETTRFYAGTQACTFITCTNFVSSNHFMEHFGGGLRVYAFHKLFVRPEGHLYIVNNNVEFSSAHAVRYGVSIGYSF
jgi:hypothetical protein